MNAIPHPVRRGCTVQRRNRFDLAAIRAEILDHENVCGEFTLNGTPAPARDQVLFKVYTHRTELLVAVAVFESVAPSLRHSSYTAEVLPNRNTIELFFAPWNDDLGWVQFCFPPDDTTQRFTHLPYPGAHSTLFPRPEVTRHRWEVDRQSASHRLYWLFAWFRTKDIFRNGSVCGFNVVRHSPHIEESSSWNHAAAVGVQDATTFGRLCLHKPGRNELTTVVLQPPTARQARAFRLSLTYDIPDNVAFTNYYTPGRLERELGIWKSWGIDRIYWIEYGPISRWPSFWDCMIGARPRFANNVELTRRHCDDMLPLAARLCHRLGMEIFAVYKPFDLGFNTEWVRPDGISTVEEIENRHVVAHPDVAAHPEWTMQAHPAWQRRVRFPVTRLCLYSEKPIASFPSRKLTLWTSSDNKTFSKHHGPIRVKLGPVNRPHHRWTPAGKVAEGGSKTNWRIELSGLAIRQPFVAIEIADKGVSLSNPMFAFAEAFDDGGSESPLELATAGDRANGFRFSKVWLGWANHTEPLFDTFTWNRGDLGLRLGDAGHIPTLLEPTFPGARQIWLDHVRRMLDAGVDGVDIRTIGHHNCVVSYLKFAFAEPVRAEFRSRFGREVEPTPADYERVRRIRGEAYTQFVREAGALVHRRGRKLAAHVEWGAEVPPRLDTRLQMQMAVEWQRWVREGIVDELSLRGWSHLNAYVHKTLLPLARRHGVGVHIITKNLPGGMDLRAMELCERMVTEACTAGLAGYNFYEADNLLRMNSRGYPMGVGHIEPALRRAADRLQAMRRGR